METLFLEDEDDFSGYSDIDNSYVDASVNNADHIPALNSEPELEHDYRPFPGSDPVDTVDVTARQTVDVGDLGIDEAVVVKEKRTVVKLDAEKLLSSNGLVSIRSQAPKVKFKGKRREYRDLGRLLQCYRQWAHALFPKAQFANFLAQTEKLGRSGPLKVARRAWIDESKPRPPTDDEESDVDDMEEQADMEQALNDALMSQQGRSYYDDSGFVVDDGDDNEDAHKRPASRKRRAHSQDEAESDQESSGFVETTSKATNAVEQPEQTLFLFDDTEMDGAEEEADLERALLDPVAVSNKEKTRSQGEVASSPESSYSSDLPDKTASESETQVKSGQASGELDGSPPNEDTVNAEPRLEIPDEREQALFLFQDEDDLFD
ncbi:replication fork protection component Swi3-domain-containing protein [Lipomyces arxii]|uniref:replication fork protection component Swi3-domain-containing protein n=1 Tax=Lipomyces arxii TaxID=56418 RepID=UPI0034CFBBD4